MTEIKRYFFLLRFLRIHFNIEFISQINETIFGIFTHDAGSHIHVWIFRSFHAQDLIFIEFSIRALPILLYWFGPKMSNLLTKIHFFVLKKIS